MSPFHVGQTVIPKTFQASHKLRPCPTLWLTGISVQIETLSHIVTDSVQIETVSHIVTDSVQIETLSHIVSGRHQCSML